MLKNYEFYKSLLSSSESSEDSAKLWDLVIITAINSEQKKCYERQLECKLRKRHIPASLKYLVINDPDSCKIGSGGSTLSVIRQLCAAHGGPERVCQMKILLIHAGGYSQRMPSSTALGKIFAPILCAHESIRDMLDIKLATFTPFAVHMRPGIFVSSSDDFVTFNYDEQLAHGHLMGSNGNDVVLFAHKSSLDVATNHGVYALQRDTATDDDEATAGLGETRASGGRGSRDATVLHACKFVLQKPSEQKMRDLGVILRDPLDGSEYAFTDSVFYFSHAITRDLVEYQAAYFDKIVADKIEIDAYRDFLQPLGTEPLDFNLYLASTGTDTVNFQQVELFRRLYELFLRRRSLLMSFSDSCFFHLGTVNELLASYVDTEAPECLKFRSELLFTRTRTESNLGAGTATAAKGCIINCRINPAVALSALSLMEFAYIESDVRLVLNDYCYLSNCHIAKQHQQHLQQQHEQQQQQQTPSTASTQQPTTSTSLTSSTTSNCSSTSICTFSAADEQLADFVIPANICMNTIPIQIASDNNGEPVTKYVTVFFNRMDDLKKKYQNLESMRFLGRPIPREWIGLLALTNANEHSIWSLKVYKACSTMHESFSTSYQQLNSYLSDSNDFLDNEPTYLSECYSLFDILRLHNYEKILSFRENYSLC